MPTIAVLDKQALRRPDFLGGRPIVLADGQEWIFPLPRVRFTTADADGFKVALDAGDGYQDRIDAYNAAFAKDGDNFRDVVRAELGLGKFLLLRNYALTPDQLASILQFSYSAGDEDGAAIRDEVVNLAMGFGPKAPAGS